MDDDFTQTRERLGGLIADTAAADPLEGLRAIGSVERDLGALRRDAVRAAAGEHTWAEIGEALGVSRQAAHHKFAKEWAETVGGELKAHARAQKEALRRGDRAAAASAEESRDARIAEFKQARKAQRKRR